MKFVAIILVAALVATGCGGSSSPSGPSAVSTPTKDPLTINVNSATQAAVKFTCSGVPGIVWKFEVYFYPVNGDPYRTSSRDPLVLEGNGWCGDVSLTPRAPVSKVVFTATNSAYPQYRLEVPIPQ